LSQQAAAVAGTVLSMQTKLAAVLAAEASDGPVNVSAVCRELGISRKHYYALRRRFAAGGVEAVTGSASRRPLRSPGQTAAELEDEIVRWRKRLVEDGLDAGARSIRYRLARDAVVPLPAVSTIHRVLRRRGLVVDEPRKRPRAADRRFAYPDPNACWQIDGTEWRLSDGSKVCIVKVIDDHSRALLGLRATGNGENLEDTWACVAAAMDRFGVPVRVLSDRGAALNGHPHRQSEFRRRLRRRGVLPISSRGYHPQTCGKTERSHQTLHKWLRKRPANTVAELQALLDAFMEIFNNDRPHQAHAGATPMSIYTARPKVAPSGVMIDTNPVVTHVKVSARGEIRTGTHTIQLGRRWQGAHVTVIREDLNVTVVSDSEVIRKLVLNPDRRYHGNGRPYPQSPKPHPRRVLPMS
jgi:transposase InsO family protein